jgi:hypothetical protein
MSLDIDGIEQHTTRTVTDRAGAQMPSSRTAQHTLRSSVSDSTVHSTVSNLESSPMNSLRSLSDGESPDGRGRVLRLFRHRTPKGDQWHGLLPLSNHRKM